MKEVVCNIIGYTEDSIQKKNIKTVGKVLFKENVQRNKAGYLTEQTVKFSYRKSDNPNLEEKNDKQFMLSTSRSGSIKLKENDVFFRFKSSSTKEGITECTYNRKITE
jgi:hypothetical protein